MKKFSLLAILAIFILPLAMYYVFKSPSMDMSNMATAEAYKAKVLQFSSPMCYDCKRIEKEMAPLRREYANTIIFQKINVSQRSPGTDQLIQQYSVDVVPTIVFLDKNGTMQGKIQGYAPQSQIRGYLDRIK